MTLAQSLYTDGWLTYHRTDGVSVAPEAVAAARTYIENTHGRPTCPTSRQRTAQNPPPRSTPTRRCARSTSRRNRTNSTTRVPRSTR